MTWHNNDHNNDQLFLKLGFCMARGIYVTTTLKLKVHSIEQVPNLCLPCSNYNCKVVLVLNCVQGNFSLLTER